MLSALFVGQGPGPQAEQIAERLDDRFRLLTGGSRTALPRQQTLRAMIDWSYDLLPESERVLLRRLSVFAGGWTLEGAETVCQGLGIDDYNVLDPLAQLVNKSLVVVDADIMPVGYDSAETRYRLLETVRQYAREKLSETGDGMAVRDLHLQYFLSLAEQAELELIGPRVMEWLKRLYQELDNLRTALEWSLKQDVQIGMKLASALMRYWVDDGLIGEGIEWLSQLLQQPASSTRNAARAKALTALGFLNGCFTEQAKSLPLAEEGLTIYRALGDQRGAALALNVLGWGLHFQGNHTAGRPLAIESLALYRALGDQPGIADALGLLGFFVYNEDFIEARAYLEESLTLCRELGYVIGIIDQLTWLGQLARRMGDYASAHSWLTQALKILRNLDSKYFLLSYIIGLLGEVSLQQGDYETARVYLEESLSLDRENGFRDENWYLVRLGYIALRQGNQAQASSLLIKAQQGFKESGRKIGVVYALEGLASLTVLQEQPERAVRLFAWADATRETIGDYRPPVEQADVDRDLATIHAQLDEATFVAAQEAGRAMTMDEAIALPLESTHD